MAGNIQRPVRETVTPAVLQMVVWAGANLSSFSQARNALQTLADMDLSAKRVRRITEQVGQDRLDERRRQVASFKDKPLMERITSPVPAESPDLGVVMLDGGRYQRRDHFGDADHDGSHWKEDKVGLVLHMDSEVHDQDPHPEFPPWLASAEAVAQIASLGKTLDEEHGSPCAEVSSTLEDEALDSDWNQFSPKLVSREVIASSECGDDFGHHLEQTAWQRGVVDAPRRAFVADGAHGNWTIHRRYFSQMTGILDLMHALSYAWKAAKALGDNAAYERYATRIWEGRVVEVIDELKSQQPPELPASSACSDDAPDPIERAITYFSNHCQRMNYPRYRQQGLPLTSSHIESTIKLVNIRMKGTEKFFRHDTGETLLQLRSDSLSDSRPLNTFWPNWLKRQTGANTYRKQAT